MDKKKRQCQEESYDDCTTKIYLDTVKEKCKCLPFQLSLNDKVSSKLEIASQIKTFLDTSL